MADAIVIKTVNLYEYIGKLSSKKYLKRDTSVIHNIIIHHEAGNSRSLKKIAEMHIAKGWANIGYHFAINYEGTIFQLQSITNVSYHTRGYNTTGIGILLMGNYEIDKPTKEMVASLDILTKSLRHSLDITRVGYHGQFGNTLCPGKNIIKKLKTIIYEN